MADFVRYAIYWAPEEPLAGAAARWLGWDPARGVAVPQPDLGPPLENWTSAPRRYGFHATIKPPFRLAAGWDGARLAAALAALCEGLAPVKATGLDVSRLGHFLALTPRGGAGALGALAAQVVQKLDPARAAPTADEIARRDPGRLSPRQGALLARWGYPYVMEEFRFHLTLSSGLDVSALDRLQPVAEAWFAAYLPATLRVEALSLFGEDAAGRFHLLTRHPLAG